MLLTKEGAPRDKGEGTEEKGRRNPRRKNGKELEAKGTGMPGE